MAIASAFMARFLNINTVLISDFMRSVCGVVHNEDFGTESEPSKY